MNTEDKYPLDSTWQCTSKLKNTLTILFYDYAENSDILGFVAGIDGDPVARYDSEGKLIELLTEGDEKDYILGVQI